MRYGPGTGAIARRFDPSSRNAVPTVQSTAMTAAWERRKLVSMMSAPDQLSAAADTQASKAPAVIAARKAAAAAARGGAPMPERYPTTSAEASAPAATCPSPPRFIAPELSAIEAPAAQASIGAVLSTSDRKE